MTTRRNLLISGLALTALPACVGGTEPRVPISSKGLPPVPVDIHNHIFNSKDIPIAEFAEQVFLRDPETPVMGGPSITRSLISLIVDIVEAANQTPTAAAELDNLKGKTRLPMRDGGDLLSQDQRAVERGLQRLENKVNAALSKRAAPGEFSEALVAPNGDAALFSLLAAESGVSTDPSSAFRSLGKESAAPISQAAQIAAGIYRDTETAEAATFATLAERETPDQSFGQNLRWAGLLTRSRVDILSELIRLYGHRSVDVLMDNPTGSNGIKVFSPSLVDFTYWLGAANDRDADHSGRDILDQIDLLSRISQLERSALLLPFAPFCPLRAAVYRKNGHGVWLDHIKNAVTSQGFAGIKLYPPMGFLPLGNTLFDRQPAKKPQALKSFGITGVQIDAELKNLYDWCATEEVPIKAHGNNSLGADACTGQNAAAINWIPVLETAGWQNLRLNIAHFGGFDEERFKPNPSCPAPVQSYEAQANDLIMKYDKLYVDIGYWTDVTGTDRSVPKEGSESEANIAVRGLMRRELARNDKLKARLMYGSDWSMIGREEQHAHYFNDVNDALKLIVPDRQERAAILGPNALRYLGMDRRGSQMDRLAAHFKNSEPFKAVISLITPSLNFAAARGLFSGR